MPRVSICIPIHDMKNGSFFLWRAVNSIMEQTFKDYEIIITKDGKMAENTNSAIRKAKGEYIKILYLDDYFAHPNALQDIVNQMPFKWLITGASTNPHPHWTDDLEQGNNKLGSPSALCFSNDELWQFDERLSWLLDCDLYKRMEKRLGKPKILDSVNVNLGIGDHQMTHLMSDDYKLSEHEYVRNKYKN